MSLIEVSLWVSGAVIGAFTAVMVQRARAHLDRERAELARLERKLREPWPPKHRLQNFIIF